MSARNPLDATVVHAESVQSAHRGRPDRGMLPGMRPVARAMGAALLAVTMLAGCGTESASSGTTSGGIDPSDASRIASGNKTAPTTSSGSKGSTSSSSKASQPTAAKKYVVPEAAKAHTHEGAKAFVKFYWETLGDLDAEPQEGVLPPFAAANCRACKMQEEATGRLVREGAHIETQSSKMSGLKIRGDSTADSVVVRFHENVKGRIKVAGGKRTPLEDIDQNAAMRADWNGKAWVMGEAGAS